MTLSRVAAAACADAQPHGWTGQPLRLRADQLHGHDAPGVIETLHRRAASGHRCGQHSDGRKVALVIEGGGMRGVLSGAGAVALARLGLTQAFDEVFATSAGAMNAAYFLSGQPDLGISIYYDELATSTFIRPWRFWKILDVDLVFNHIVTVAKPLNLDALTRAATRCLIAMIDRTHAEPLLIDLQRSPSPPLDILKAATAIPVLYNRTVPLVEAGRCMDGGLLNPFPVYDAIRSGATDVLVLLTRPRQYVRAPSAFWPSLAFDVVAARRRSELWGLLRHYHRVDHRFRSLVLGDTAPPATSPGVRIATFCPEPPSPDHPGLARTSTDPEQLYDAGVRYGSRLLATLGADPDLIALPPPARISQN